MFQAPITPPATVTDFKAWYVRGWRYGAGPGDVMDSDISNAIQLALTVFNPNLFNSVEAKPVFLLAVAFFVVRGIQAAGGLQPQLPGTPGLGLTVNATENTGSGVTDMKTAKDISIKYAGFEKLCEQYPTLAQFRQNDFGIDYATIVAPRLKCRVGITPNPSSPDAVIPAVPFLA